MTQIATKPFRPRADWAVITIAILMAVAAIVFARSFLMPVVLAFLLSLTFSPVRRILQRRGVPSVATAFVVVSLLLVLTGFLAYALSGPIQSYTADRDTIVRDAERKLRGISEAIEQVSEASNQVEELTSGGADGEQLQKVVVDQPDLVTRMVFSAPVVLGQTVFTLVLLFFLIAGGDIFYEKIVEVIPKFSDKKRAVQISRDIERQLSRYFLTITGINAGLGVAIGLVLWWMDMPTPLLFGTLAFLLNFVPYLGAIVGVAITTGIGIVSYDTVGQAFAVGGAYFALTTIEGQLVTPYAVGRRLELNPVIVFLAVAFWGWAWSVMGMVIAVPTLISIKVFSDHVPGLNGLSIFLAGRPEQHATDDDKAEDEEKEAG